MVGGWLCVFIICVCAWYGDTARILIVVSTPSISHQVVFRPIAQELARRHRVVILTTDPAFPDQAPPNLTEIDLHNISYGSWTDRFLKTTNGKQNDLYTQVDMALAVILEIFPKQMRSEAVKKVFEKEKQFDLVIAEGWTRPARALSHVFKAPVILVTTFGGTDEQYQLMGAPVNPILYPDFLRMRLFNLTLWEKVRELYNRYKVNQLIMAYQEKEDEMLRDLFGKDTPPLEDLNKNVELLMVNVDPVFEGYRPVPHNVIHLGSLNCAPSEDLPRVVFRPIAQELAKRHRVVILTTDPAFPDQAPPNLTEIDLHDVSYTPWIDRFLKTATGKQNDLYAQTDMGHDLVIEIFQKQIKSDAVKKVFEKEKQFDLVIAEAWTRPARALSHVFKAPVILISTLGGTDEQYNLMGAPVDLILYPDFLRTRLFNLTLWEKVTELYNRFKINRLIMAYEEKEDEMLRDLFGKNTPTLEELNKNVELLMVNIDPVFEGYRPLPPNVIHLGSLNCAPSEDLPQDLKSWMDSSKYGVIYVSFGTNANPSLLPPERMAIFIRVFEKLPYDVLWKWKEPPTGLPANVRTSAWLPQSDLLRHKKLVLFITQGGLQSTDEALRAGVPLLAFPMLADQWFNAEQYERLGVGRRLEFASFTDDQLRENIEELIKDKGYRTRSKLLSEEMQDRSESSLERAVWWIERTLRRRTRRRAPAVHVSWLTFIDGDIAAAVVVLIIGVLLALYGLYKMLMLTRRSMKVKTT